MKFMKFVGGMLAIIVSSVLIYVIAAYSSKQLVLKYYQWRDNNYNWLAEYKDVKIKDKYKIVFIISDPTIIADHEAGNRMLAAMKNLGWETHTFEMIEGNEEKIKKINPDFIFTNKWNLHFGMKEKLPRYKLYALLPHPTATYFSGFFEFYPRFKQNKFPEIEFIDGFIVSMPEVSLFKNYVESRGRKFYGFKGYSSVQHQAYVEVEPRQLVYMGMNWDSRRKSGKFAKIFKTLADKKEAIFYGSANSWQHLVNDAYKGYFEGSDTAVLDKLRESGISLLFHSKQHIKSGAPSGRSFETAAAGVIGISDRHPFIIENFGDSFLYIDIDSSAERIISQIEKHLQWIKANPDKAKAKARKAYEIFVKNYTLESYLINLAKMHEKILLDEAATSPNA